MARAQRRRQALDALHFERDRESSLREQLEETVTELEGPAVDEETFARMTAEDVDLVRQTLLDTGDDFGHEPGTEPAEDWLEEFRIGDEPAEVDREERLSEVARLEGEIQESQRRQQALGRYLEALDGG